MDGFAFLGRGEGEGIDKAEVCEGEERRGREGEMGGSEGHFEEGGGWEKDGVLDEVVVEKGRVERGNVPFPEEWVGRGGGVKGASKEGMRTFFGGGRGIGRSFEPIALALEGVGRERDVGAFVGIEVSPGNGSAVGIEEAEGEQEGGPLVVMFAKAGNSQGRRSFGREGSLLKDGIDGGKEDGMGTELEEDGIAIVTEGLKGGAEEDGVAEVLRPIGGRKGAAVHGFTGDGGVEGDAGFLGTERKQSVVEVGEQVVDLGTMKGDIGLNSATEDVVLFKASVQGFDGGQGAGKNNGVRTIDGGEGDVVFEAMKPGRELSRFLVNQEHSSLAANTLEELAANTNQGDGIFQGEGTGDMGGRNLPHAVSDNGMRLQAPGGPHGSEGDLDGEEQGLDDVRTFVKKGCFF